MRRPELGQLGLQRLQRLLEKPAFEGGVAARRLVRNDEDLRDRRTVVLGRLDEHSVQTLDLGQQLRVVEIAAVQIKEALVDPVSQHEPRPALILPARLPGAVRHAEFAAIAFHGRPVRLGLVDRIVAKRDRIVVVVPQLVVQGDGGQRRAGVVRTVAQAAVVVAGGHQGEVEIRRAQQASERIVPELRIAAELEHVAVKGADHFAIAAGLLGGAQEAVHRVRNEVVVEQVPIDDLHFAGRIAKGAFIAARLAGRLRRNLRGLKVDVRDVPRPAKGIPVAVLPAQPFPERGHRVRAVIAEFLRVDAPMIPLFAHQAGDRVAEQAVAIVRRLHVRDDPLQRRGGVGPPASGRQRRERFAVAPVTAARRIALGAVGQHLALREVGGRPPSGRRQVDPRQNQALRIRLQHAVGEHVELPEIKFVRAQPHRRGKAGPEVRGKAEHVRPRLGELAKELRLRHVGLEHRLGVRLVVDKECGLAAVSAHGGQRARDGPRGSGHSRKAVPGLQARQRRCRAQTAADELASWKPHGCYEGIG